MILDSAARDSLGRVTYQGFLGVFPPSELGFHELDLSVREQDWYIIWATQHQDWTDADLGVELALRDQLAYQRDAVEYIETMLKKPS